jgi:hypothetical protein
MRYFTILLLPLLVTACATDPAQQVAYQKQVEQRDQIIEAKIAASQKPLCKLECPDQGCTVKSFECNAENDLVIPNIAAPASPHKYWSDALVRMFGIGVPAWMGIEGFHAIRDTALGLSGPTYNYTDSYNSGNAYGDSSQIGDRSTPTTTNTGNVIGDGSMRDGQLGMTDNSDHSAVDNSDHSAVDNSDHSITDDHTVNDHRVDSTHIPTVVRP